MSGIAATIARAGHTVDIEKPAETLDGVGARVSGFALYKQEVLCWVQDADTRTVTEFGSREIRVTHVVYFCSDPEVLEGYRLLFDARLFVVVGVSNAAGLNRLWKVVAREGK